MPKRRRVAAVQIGRSRLLAAAPRRSTRLRASARSPRRRPMYSSYDCTALLYDHVHPSREWGMSHGERGALLQVLGKARPESAIEIGTDQGGSLEQIRRFATMTYSIDL